VTRFVLPPIPIPALKQKMSGRNKRKKEIKLV
jgi:hypothetical protein